MKTLRQRAIRKRNIAYFLFALGIGNILVRALGLVDFDTSNASNLEQIYDMEWEFFVLPLIPLIIGYFFWNSYKDLVYEAEQQEAAAARDARSAPKGPEGAP